MLYRDFGDEQMGLTSFINPSESSPSDASEGAAVSYLPPKGLGNVHTAFQGAVWLSYMQLGSRMGWSAPAYVRAIIIHKPTILNSSKPAEVRVAGWCLSERARSTPDLTEKTPESHSRLPMLNRNLPLISTSRTLSYSQTFIWIIWDSYFETLSEKGVRRC